MTGRPAVPPGEVPLNTGLGDDALPIPNGPIRIGIMTNSGHVPRWFATGIRQVLTANDAGERAQFAMAAAIEAPAREASESRRSLGRRLYDAVDRRRASPDREMLEDVALLQFLGPLTGSTTLERLAVDDTGQLTGESSALVRDRSLDLLLLCTDRVPIPVAAACARLGACVFVLSDYAAPGERADGFQEVISASGLVGARLELYRDSAAAPVFVVDTVTNSHPYSAIQTRARAAGHAVTLLDRLITAVWYGIARPNHRVQATLDRVRTARTNAARCSPTVLTFASLARRYAGMLTRRSSPIDRWEMAWRWDAAGDTDGHPHVDITGYETLRPPPDRFWADPFPLRVDDRYFALFEELQFSGERGYIRAVEIGPSGALGEPVTVLDRPFHLSYPFVFKHEGAFYMLPEMCLEGRLELYRAVRPPFEWVLDRIVMDNAYLIDATLANIDGRWWLFACRFVPGLREWNDLVLFHSDSPFGPWLPHAANPVVSDVRCARPAGALYTVNGAWYRPAQDCTRTYGGALTIRRITRLTDTEYEEEEFKRIDPPPSGVLEGVHSLNRAASLTMIDMKRRR